MNEKELREFRERFEIPISDDVIAETPFYRPPADSPETKYLLERREGARRISCPRAKSSRDSTCRSLDYFAEFFKARLGNLHDDGFRQRAERFAAASRHQPEHRADHSRRSAHVWA
jgi:hypothetical protein